MYDHDAINDRGRNQSDHTHHPAVESSIDGEKHSPQAREAAWMMTARKELDGRSSNSRHSSRGDRSSGINPNGSSSARRCACLSGSIVGSEHHSNPAYLCLQDSREKELKWEGRSCRPIAHGGRGMLPCIPVVACPSSFASTEAP